MIKINEQSKIRYSMINQYSGSSSFQNRKNVIGIDLHGTLLNEKWEIAEETSASLVAVLKRLKDSSYLFVCSGNDLSFVKRVLPVELFEIFDGFVLENGCVFSNGNNEELLVSEKQVSQIKSLENRLKKESLPDLIYYGNRLSTISLFTKDKGSGVSPYNLYLLLKEQLETDIRKDEIIITHSDVAVDILPAGNSKYNGIDKICPGLRVFAVADSYNDLEFLLKASGSFLPDNCSAHLEEELMRKGCSIMPLNRYKDGTEQMNVYKSNYSYTEGVLDILYRLEKSLQPEINCS